MSYQNTKHRGAYPDELQTRSGSNRAPHNKETNKQIATTRHDTYLLNQGLSGTHTFHFPIGIFIPNTIQTFPNLEWHVRTITFKEVAQVTQVKQSLNIGCQLNLEIPRLSLVEKHFQELG